MSPRKEKNFVKKCKIYLTKCKVYFTFANIEKYPKCKIRRKIMNRAQKTAWLLVITISAGFVLSCIAVVILYIKSGMPTALAGFMFMAVAAFGGLGPSIFKKDKGNVIFNERDKLLKRRAALAGFGTSYRVWNFFLALYKYPCILIL